MLYRNSARVHLSGFVGGLYSYVDERTANWPSRRWFVGQHMTLGTKFTLRIRFIFYNERLDAATFASADR